MDDYKITEKVILDKQSIAMQIAKDLVIAGAHTCLDEFKDAGKLDDHVAHLVELTEKKAKDIIQSIFGELDYKQCLLDVMKARGVGLTPKEAGDRLKAVVDNEISKYPDTGRTQANPPVAPAQSGELKCPTCGGGMWDNRQAKREGKFKPNAPDAKCKNKDCGGVIWKL